MNITVKFINLWAVFKLIFLDVYNSLVGYIWKYTYACVHKHTKNSRGLSPFLKSGTQKHSEIWPKHSYGTRRIQKGNLLQAVALL